MDRSGIKAVLCDIGGVLYVGDTPIDGAIEAIQKIKERYPVRFVTNTTQKTGAQVVTKLQQLGFGIEASEVITALDVTKAYLLEHESSAEFLLTEDARTYFKPLESFPKRFVVVGDAQENFTYENLNAAFRTLIKGGELLAAAKNRCFKDADGELSMDAGGFVSALEYASGKTALIIGKPSRTFFHQACAALQTDPQQCVMIGDDIESDVAGAQAAGLKAVLVRTGKFCPEHLRRGIKPDAVADSIAAIEL